MLKEMKLRKQAGERFTSEQRTTSGIEQFAPAREVSRTHYCGWSNISCKAFQQIVTEHSEEVTELGQLTSHVQVAFAAISVHQLAATQADSVAVPVLCR